MNTIRYHSRRFVGQRQNLWLLALAVLLSACGAAPPAQVAQHVVVIGVDGMSPDGVRSATTPHMDELISRGARSFTARAVMPSSSSSNWASMIMGAGPEQHGITSNDWEPDEHILPPVCTGSADIFPSIFGLVREQRPDAGIGVFHDWDGFGRLFERDAPSEIVDGDGPQATVDAAAAYIRESQPLLTFVHLDHVDGAGHSEGHGSPAYYAAVEDADRLIGEVVAAVEEAGILDDTVFIITSDHGGSGTGHGGVTLEEMEIPWIVAGPSVRPQHTIDAPVDTYDTAATVAYLLNITPHDCWVASPVESAFAN